MKNIYINFHSNWQKQTSYLYCKWPSHANRLVFRLILRKENFDVVKSWFTFRSIVFITSVQTVLSP